MTGSASPDSHDRSDRAAWQRAVHVGFDRLAETCVPGSRGWCVGAACILEASAPKPGNVHPGAGFPDLAHEDLVAAGIAIAPVMDQAPATPLGRTILAAVEASCRVTRSNANLGIVLAIAPLAAAEAFDRVPQVLSGLGPADAADVWRAIALAQPGGMGTSDRHDLRKAPPTDLLAAMRAAAHRDQIARLWATGYADLFTGPVADLAAEVAAGSELDDAIVRTHLRQLAREPDTLIVRRHGADVGADVSRRAREVLAAGADWRPAATAFDHALRFPKRVNPGTTADLIAAAVYILLREGRIRID
jgi:triphosphoribosyl-dephospho-CoA synthase